MRVKRLVKRSVCAFLSVGMILTGLPGAGMITSLAGQYVVQEGEIPLKASSLEELPLSVNCVEEGTSIQTPKNITWEIKGNGSFYNAGSTVSVTGTITENGQKVTASVLAVPKNVVYLVDANIPALDESSDYKRFKENGDVSLLKNEVPDRAYSAGTWGYTGILNTDINGKGKIDALKDTKSYTGYYANPGKKVSYKLPLEAGAYIAAAEFMEWWSNYQRTIQMKVTYIDESGQTRTDDLDTGALAAQYSMDTAAGSFTIKTDQEVLLTFEKKAETSAEAVLSGFTIIKAKEELPPQDKIPVTIDGTRIDEENTFGGFGSVTCNNTSRLLMDYKALHEDNYWEMMKLLFDKNEGAGLNHVKIEMGADVNSSSGTEPATMRSPDEIPNVKRGAGFHFAEDALSINPDITVEILRWGEPKWTQEGIGFEGYENPKYEARYQWYRRTIDAAYETYGYKITEVSPGQNERRKDYADDFAWIKYCAKRFDEDGENGIGAFDYREIKIVAADLYRGMNTTVDYLMKDDEMRDLVDVISDHYQIWMGSGNLTKLNQEYGKEVWYGESTAPMINAYYRANVDPDRGGIGGSASIAAMAERFISAYAYKNKDGYTSHMTELLFQPAIGAFYEGSAYSPKQLIGAFDPWSGYYEADGGIQMVQHFMQFADSDWNYLPDACYCDGTTGDGDITADTSTDTRLSVKDPETDDYSVIFANNTSSERKYQLTLKNMKTSGSPYNIWETRGPDAGDSFDANWFQKTADNAIPKDNGDGTSTIELTVKPYSIVTLTSLTDRGTSYTSGQNDSGVERSVLELPYRDDFDYEDAFVEERGGTPLFTTDIEGAFEVEKSEDTGNVLTQVINGNNRPYNWNPWGSGSDESSQTTNIPWTVLGDHRWANYTAGIDVKLDTKGKGYGDNFAVLGAREVVHSSGAAYRAKIYESGKWELLRFNTVKKSGKLENFDSALWHKLQIKADENVITIYVDGEEAGSFTDQESPVMTGRITLMSGFWNTRFDNLEVMPIEGKTAFSSARLDDTSSLISWQGSVTHNICQGFAYYNRSYTTMPAGSSLEFAVPEGIGFDVFGNSGKADIKVTVDGQNASAATLASGNRETSYWNEGLGDGKHNVKIEVIQGTYKVDGINLFTEPFDYSPDIHTDELAGMIDYVKSYDFDGGKYPENLIKQVKQQLEKAEGVLALPESQKEVDLARISLRNAFIKVVPSDTIISVKDLPDSIAAIQNSMPELPETLTVINAAGEEIEKNVTWKASEDDFRTLWDKVEVIGQIEDSGFKINTIVMVIPYGLTYFIDSGAAGVTDSNGEIGHSEMFDTVAGFVNLENECTDKVYEEGSWGYEADEAVSTKSSTSISYQTGIYESGLYVDYFKDTDIVYKIPMSAGKYKFIIGAQAYWNETHSSNIQIRYKDAQEEWQSVELGKATVSASSGNIQFMKTAEIPVDGLVEIRIKKADTKIHLISWLAVAREAEVEMPSTLITAKGNVPELPNTVLVQGEEKEVTWKSVAKKDFDTPWTSVKVKGTVEEVKIPVSVNVEIIPDNLVYFIDSGVHDREESSYYCAIEEAVSGLKNEVPDKLYEEDSWGYAEADDLGGPMESGSDSRAKTGWWAKSGKEINYKLPLEAGKYQFTSGYYEWWWVNRAIEAYVVYKDADGQEITSSLGKITLSKPEESILYPKAEIEIPVDQTVEFRVKKTGGSDPIISWVAVNQVKENEDPDDEDPDEPVYHTTKIKVTQSPTKKEYEVGDELDKTGMEVTRYETASPSNAARAIVIDEDDYETDYNFSEPGRKEVKVSYSEWDEEGEEKTFADSFYVTVKEEIPEEEYYTTKIKITKNPKKLNYILGEDLDTEGLEVIEYQKASPSCAVRKNVLTEDDYDLEYDLSIAGKRKVKVIFYGEDKRREEKRFTDFFTVKVTDPFARSESDDDDEIYDSGKQNSEDSEYYYGTWQQDENGWRLMGKDGTNPVDRWARVQLKDSAGWYFFNEKGYMITGWFSYEGSLYYLDPNSGSNKGCMLTGWQMISGNWYYFNEKSDGSQGAMLKGTVTPDGYQVGSDGAWIH